VQTMARAEMARLITQVLAPVQHGSIALAARAPHAVPGAARPSRRQQRMLGCAAGRGGSGPPEQHKGGGSGVHPPGLAPTWLPSDTHVPGEEWVRFFAAYASEALKTG
jgi:hypothetical protein